MVSMRVIFIPLLLVIAACNVTTPMIAEAEASAVPEWVMNPPQKAGFVFGVGSAEIYTTDGEALDRAAANARKNLASNIRVVVQSTDTIRTSINDGALTESINLAVRSEVPELELPGVTIEKNQKSGRTLYALAVLDREKALSGLRTQVDSVKQQLTPFLSRNVDSLPPLDRLRQLVPALKLFEQWRQLDGKIRDLSEGLAAYPIEPEHEKLEQKIYKDINKISFKVMLTDKDTSLRSGLVQALTQNGISVTEQGQADITLKYKVDWSDLFRGDRVFAVAIANVSLTDSTGKVFAELRQKTKAGSTNYNYARQKAMEKLAEQFSKDISEQLLNLK